jgi:hypothetical protein
VLRVLAVLTPPLRRTCPLLSKVAACEDRGGERTIELEASTAFNPREERRRKSKKLAFIVG